MKFYKGVKLILDTFFAVSCIILLSPVLLIISIIVKLDSSGPVLFRQKRIGKDCIEFNIYKFRTMKTDTPDDMPTHLFHNAKNYITRSGSLLRRSSLDELPQLINILKGQMSFIGPRPALWNQYDLIEARRSQRQNYGVDANSIKPGITGWAQVNGRDELHIIKKAELDGYYAANLNLLFDIKILIMTIFNTISGKGISEGGHKL